ncbi:META domain-containing protein [Nocardia thailandica]|uniref:META domain-containing protein n=1 Tax=Nocardia thailandica TaxID=257275 RepID=UPI0002E28154|nr:META domain-containing protein [Nocardia thailandica]
MTAARTTLTALLALAAATAAACGSSGDDAGAGTATPMGHTYVSTAVEGTPIPGGGPMTLAFADGRLTADSGCNKATGTVDLADHVLRVEGMASTLMGCPGERGQADGWQDTFLKSSPTWRLDGDALTLTGAGSTVRLLDKKVATPDAPLTGTAWTVRSLLTPSGQVSSATIEEVRPNLTIDAMGNLTGFAGCNRMTGTAAVGPGENVSFAVATTRMMCAPEVMEVEADVLKALDGRTNATVDADTLTLRNDNGYGLVLRAG